MSVPTVRLNAISVAADSRLRLPRYQTGDRRMKLTAFPVCRTALPYKPPCRHIYSTLVRIRISSHLNSYKLLFYFSPQHFKKMSFIQFSILFLTQLILTYFLQMYVKIDRTIVKKRVYKRESTFMNIIFQLADVFHDKTT